MNYQQWWPSRIHRILSVVLMLTTLFGAACFSILAKASDAHSKAILSLRSIGAIVSRSYDDDTSILFWNPNRWNAANMVGREVPIKQIDKLREICLVADEIPDDVVKWISSAPECKRIVICCPRFDDRKIKLLVAVLPSEMEELDLRLTDLSKESTNLIAAVDCKRFLITVDSPRVTNVRAECTKAFAETKKSFAVLPPINVGSFSE